jgi:hypothetical protein
VSFHDLEELPDLIRFRLAVDFLQVYELRDLRMHEYVVTPPHTRQNEAERFHERDGFREAYGPRVVDSFGQELAFVHVLLIYTKNIRVRECF